MTAPRNPIHLATGLWELALLAVRSRFRLRGKYWRWRTETAFGTNSSTMPAPRARRGAVLAYGRWVNRMKRLR